MMDPATVLLLIRQNRERRLRSSACGEIATIAYTYPRAGGRVFAIADVRDLQAAEARGLKEVRIFDEPAVARSLGA